MTLPGAIVSGGQTGADRAALDVAIERGIPHEGWCPKGRKCEDGTIGTHYLLRETPGKSGAQRTEWNVRDTDGTIVFTFAAAALGGSLKTIDLARKLKKPCLHISRDGDEGADPVLLVQKFITEHRIDRLNVAGSRESKEPGIYAWVRETLSRALL